MIMKLNRLSLLFFGNAALCGALVFASIAPTSAAAGTVYRCTGANGQLAFTNKPGGYTGCTKVANYADAPAAKTAAERGRKALYERVLTPPILPIKAYENAWKHLANSKEVFERLVAVMP